MYGLVSLSPSCFVWPGRSRRNRGRPPVPPSPINALSAYPLDAPPWNDWYGEPARGFTNLNVVGNWDTTDGPSVSLDTNAPAFLNYDVYQDGYTNIVFDHGSFSIWCQANWTSTTDGGAGPTNWAVLFSVGNWTSNAAQSAWTLAVSPEGTNLVLEAQSAGSHQIVFNVPIDFDAGDWHCVTVTYSSSNCCLYLEGQMVTNAEPITNIPSAGDCTNYGMFVGSLSTAGLAQFHGQFQWLDTYDYPLSTNEIADDYAQVSSYIAYYGGSLPALSAGLGGFHGDYEGPPVPGQGGDVNTNGGGGGGIYPLFTNAPPNTNDLWLFIAQTTNQTVVVTMTNTIAGSNYLLLAATNLLGPWVTNQSLQAPSGTNVTVFYPIGILDAVDLYFIGKQAPGPTNGSLKWVVNLVTNGVTDAFGTGLDASPAISPFGPIYIPTANSNLFAIDPISGTVLWSTNIVTPTNATLNQAAMVTGSAAVGSDGTVYVGYFDGNLYSINPSGQTNWVHPAFDGSAVCSTPAIASDGLIIVCSDGELTGQGGVTAFNPNGTTNWVFQPQDLESQGYGGAVTGSPVVGADGTVYFESAGSRLYALWPDGHLKWFLPVPSAASPVDPTPSIAPDGSIVVGSSETYLYYVNPDGSLHWILSFANLTMAQGIVCEPAIGPEGVIYSGSGNYTGGGGGLVSINPDGLTNWAIAQQTGSTVGSPALASDGTLYYGTGTPLLNTFYAVSNNGTILWSTNIGAGIYSAPAILPDGSVVVSAEDGNLYCFWGSAPPATNAPWPMFQHDPAHTGQATPTAAFTNGSAPFVFNGDNDGTANFFFSMTGVPGTSNWNVYASTNLATTNWTLLATNLVLDSVTGNAYFTDSNVAGMTQRFYVVSSNFFSSNACSSKAIGFVKQIIAPGTNLIADQLYQVDDGILYNLNWPPMNTVNALFAFSNAWSEAQSGTAIYKWNGTGFVGVTNVGSTEVVWSDYQGLGAMTLLPGIGVLMNNRSVTPFTNWFNGLLREQQVFNIQPGTNYLSATVPMAGTITSITGYVPQNGDTIKLWNSNTQVFQSYTNISSAWQPSNPAVNVGEGFVLITTNSYTWTNTWQPSP
jgi:outer membrane protein assembly factor BamB